MADNNDRPRLLRDYRAPSVQGFQPSVTRPIVEANNFELKPAWLQMIQQTQFVGSPTEDPHYHLQCFLAFCDTFKMNGVSDQAIRLRAFPFSLRDKARKWLLSQPAGITVDSATEGDLMEKTVTPALELLERVAYHNYEWSNERGNAKRTAGVLEVDAVSMINAEFDKLTSRLDKMQANTVRMNSQHEDNYGGGYSEYNSFNKPSTEQMNYVNNGGNFNQRQPNNPYSNTYNPRWRNNPNFSWSNQQN
ncbi:hypothetical protein P3X46_012309 [Hevea brasiliensis]|uniref:Retrotransposon gag domain-containing protein n=1 Tax=Hevea brasiliensis TaxID=3981 RepID=A0ABQ9MA90_HEVBR|nr:hypothetical protein P3X46_012309 [Hevea brasiliensis]